MEIIESEAQLRTYLARFSNGAGLGVGEDNPGWDAVFGPLGPGSDRPPPAADPRLCGGRLGHSHRVPARMPEC